MLAATFQDERKESTKGVATRPAACQGELLSTCFHGRVLPDPDAGRSTAAKKGSHKCMSVCAVHKHNCVAKSTDDFAVSPR